MTLGYEEVLEIIPEINDIIYERVIRANQIGNLKEYLREIDVYQYLYDDDDMKQITSYSHGMIAVIGESDVKKNHLIGIAKSLGLSKDRFEFCLNYEEIKQFNFSKLKNPKYRVVLAGPMPHSIQGKGKFDSMIDMMKNTEEYPRIEMLKSSNELKISKSNFREALESLLGEGYIIT